MKRLTERWGKTVPLNMFAFLLVMPLMLCSLPGCGGSDSTAAYSGPSGTSAITKAHLIKQADAICRRTDMIQTNAVKAYGRKHGEPDSANELTKMLVRAGLPPIETEINLISALGAPKGNEAQITAIIKALEKALSLTEAKPSVLLHPDEGFFERPDKLAGNYGFIDCAQAL